VRTVPDPIERDSGRLPPDRLWATDITDGSTWEGFHPLGGGARLLIRRVVNWSMSDSVLFDGEPRSGRALLAEKLQ
jgi:hypothetical protein